MGDFSGERGLRTVKSSKKAGEKVSSGLVFNLHRWSGLAVGLLLLVIGLTGSSLVFQEPLERTLDPGLYSLAAGVSVDLGFSGAHFVFIEPFKAALYKATGTSEPARLVSIPAGKPSLTADVALIKARVALAGAQVQGIRLPTKPDAVYEVRGLFTGEGAASRTIRVFIDQYSGRILRVQDARRPNAAEWVLNWLRPLHFGTAGGLVTQVAYVFVGLTPGGLFLTGFVLWLAKLRRTRVKAAAQSVAG